MRKELYRGYKIATSNLRVSRYIAYSALIVGLLLLANIVDVANGGYESLWIPFIMVAQTAYLGVAFILLTEYRAPNPILEKMRIK